MDKSWGRLVRVGLGLTGPPILGTVFLVAIIGFAHPINLFAGPVLIFPILFYAVVWSVVPTMITTIVMEILYAKVAPPSSLKAVFLYAAFGLLAGLVLAAFTVRLDHEKDATYVFPSIGLVVGLFQGGIIFALSRSRKDNGGKQRKDPEEWPN